MNMHEYMTGRGMSIDEAIEAMKRGDACTLDHWPAGTWFIWIARPDLFLDRDGQVYTEESLRERRGGTGKWVRTEITVPKKGREAE